MDYQKEVLKRLLRKYEKSKAFYDNSTNRGIMLRPADEPDIMDRMESADEKREFLYSMSHLADDGIVRIQWVKYEENNLIEKIYLLIGETSLQKAYSVAGMKKKADELDSLLELLSRALLSAGNESWIQGFFNEMTDFINEKHSLPRFFRYPEKERRDLITALLFLDEHSKEEILIRVFSIRCYGDSKYFEKNVKSHLLSVLRYCFRNENQGDMLSDEDLLSMAGIQKSPEIMEFCGNLSIRLKNGSVVDYSHLIYGAYINSETADNVESVLIPDVQTVTFIENKTNYLWYISEKGQRQPDELVIYHGGCYSPVRGRWFRRIYDARAAESVLFRHSSDIDVGGFRIFVRLRDTVIPSLVPYRMGLDTYEAFKRSGVKFDAEYGGLLSAMRDDSRYEVFYDVIGSMLRDGIKIEQETMVV